MACSAFLSLFHTEHHVLCTCVYQSLPGLYTTFPSAAMNPDLYNTQHGKAHTHAVVLSAPSEHPLCHFIFCGSAHWACTCHLAKDCQCCDDSAELSNILKLITWGLPETVLYTHFQTHLKHFQTHQEEQKGKKVSHPGRFMESLGPPTKLQNQTTTKCWSLKV